MDTPKHSWTPYDVKPTENVFQTSSHLRHISYIYIYYTNEGELTQMVILNLFQIVSHGNKWRLTVFKSGQLLRPKQCRSVFCNPKTFFSAKMELYSLRFSSLSNKLSSVLLHVWTIRVKNTTFCKHHEVSTLDLKLPSSICLRQVTCTLSFP